MPRLLLIDDDEHLAAPLAAYLQRFDLTLESALRPSLGLARLREGGFDAVILDVMLPEMDGFDVCRAIRRDPALAGLPILMLTARGRRDGPRHRARTRRR
jgi:two-component system OmpR family response regulator